MHVAPDTPADGRGDDALPEDRTGATFIDLAGALTRGDDVVGLLERLTTHGVAMLGVATAGLLLAGDRDALHLVAASSMETRDLEVLQAQHTEGPGRDCFLRGRRVTVADLGEHVARWPLLVPTALDAGFRSIHAVPVRRLSHTLGVLVLLGDDTGALEDVTLALAQGLADVASIALTLDRGHEGGRAAQLQAALDDRTVLEQAKGFLAQRGDLSIAQAGEVLSSFGRCRDLSPSEVAKAVVTRELPPAALLGDLDTGT